MSTEAALLRAIRDNPDDDTARLVYADLLEEEGDPDRAEFIRVQIALTHTPDDPARRALEDREHQLLAEHESEWLGVAHDTNGLMGWEFRRGFVERVWGTPNFMRNEGPDLCAVHPVRRWDVRSSQGDMAEDLLEAGRQSWFSRLEALNLVGWFQTIGELERFLTRSDFARLRELDLTGRPGLAELPHILERLPCREQLRVLRCAGRFGGEAENLDTPALNRALAPARLTQLAVPSSAINADDVRTLLRGDFCLRLTSLDIRDNQIEPDGWLAFGGTSYRLRELDLSGTPLGGIALDEVLRASSLSELRVLHLNRCGSAMANIRALAASRFWSQAEELRMSHGTIPQNALDPLFTGSGPPGLRVLDVSANYFRDVGVAELCAAPWAASLQQLDLSANYLTDVALDVVASSDCFSQLRSLALSDNNPLLEGAEPGEGITDRGVRFLAETDSLPALRELWLSGTQVTNAGLESLLNRAGSPLRSLDLTQCSLDPDAVRVLANSPATASLRFLGLGGESNRLGGDALMPLAESPYLSPLCELFYPGFGVNRPVITALRQRLGGRLARSD